MSLRLIRLLLALNVLACVVLAILWMHARHEHATLEQKPRHTHAAQQSAAKKSQLLQQQLSERLALIEERRREIAAAPSSIELQRRAAALAAITQLKEARAIHPPPPSQKQPPRTPRANFGDVFPELLVDPEYSAHALVTSKRMFQIYNGKYLRKIGADDAAIDKVAQLYAESRLLNLDYRAMLGDDGAEQSHAVALRQKQQQDIEAETKSILGEEKYARFHSLRQESETDFRRLRLEPLATRLSYTNSPLTTETIDKLYALLKKHAVPGGSDRAILADPLVEDARSILTPEQHAAYRQLQAEMRAKDKRAKLPKSSEIPRL